MKFLDAVKTCLVRYVDFNGRASRSELWYFVLATTVVYLLIAFVDPDLLPLAALGLTIPELSARVRRLHDTGRSGWWIFICLIPVIGGVLLIVWWCEKGAPGPNAYGDEPSHQPPAGPKIALWKPARSGDLERLERLHALHESGALTADEFAAEKAKVLSAR